MRLIKYILSIFIIGFLAAGCLTVERKDFTINLNADGSGNMTIRYVNLVSKFESEPDSSIVDNDFNQLIYSFDNDKRVLKDYPNVKNIRKRLFEEDGVLNAEVTFEFDQIQDVKLYSYDDKSPYMVFAGGIGELYKTSNGKYGNQDMPVIFWDKGIKILQWSMSVQSDLKDTESLLQKYKEWESKQ